MFKFLTCHDSRSIPWVLRTAPILVLTAMAALAAITTTGIVLRATEPYGDGHSYFIDFVAIWGAAKLTMQGAPLLAYDPHALRAVQDLAAQTPATDLMPWLYPPHALLAAAPIGSMPFALAFPAFVALCLIAWTMAMSRPLRGTPVRTSWLFASPPLFLSVILGQPSLLWMAGLVAVIEALRCRRTLVAGVLLGLMTMKPNLGLLIPFALLAAMEWRVIITGTAATLLLAISATLVVGAAAWPAFIDIVALVEARIASGEMIIDKMVGSHAFLRAMGADHATALALSPFTVVAAAALVGAVWRRDSGATFDAKAAVLCLASYVALPHLHYYDAILLWIGALYWIRAVDALGAFGTAARVLLISGWVASWFLLVKDFPVAILLTPIALTAIGWLLCLHTMRRPALIPLRA